MCGEAMGRVLRGREKEMGRREREERGERLWEKGKWEIGRAHV